MNVKKLNTDWIDITALGSTGLVTIGYILFAAKFAESNIRFSFLNFPVFVSEFLLMLCFCLFLLKLSVKPVTFNQWHFLMILYFGFVLIKSTVGYVHSGPLALRNAALMYYPVFAVFGYMFYQRKYFGQAVNIILSLIICFIFWERHYYGYYTLTLFILGLLAVKAVRNRWVQVVLGIMILVMVPYTQFYDTARMMILAHLVFFVYLVVTTYLILKWPRKTKLLIAGFCIIGFLMMMVKFAGVSRVKSIFDFAALGTIFEEYDSKVREQKPRFKFEERKDIKIYHPEKSQTTEQSTIGVVTIKPEEVSVQPPQSPIYVQIKPQQAVAQETAVFNETVAEASVPQAALQKDPVKEQVAENKKVVPENTFLPDANNSVFRLLIWRDMLDEYKHFHPIFGFDFGKPFRSISLEVLEWGKSEWERDGWVAAHNSFLHMIYRSGIVGVIFIGCIVILLLKMIRDFFIFRSFTGILLCGLILSWFVASNFLIVLEIPYTAIPIWSLYGLTFAYYQSEVKTKKGTIHGVE